MKNNFFQTHTKKLLATKYELFQAKLCGKKLKVLDVTPEGQTEMTGYLFKNKLYLTKWKYILERKNMKKWWQSKTILASLMTAITIITGMFAPEISEKLAIESAGIVESVAAIAGIVGTALAIYGRLVVKDDIVK